jgi:hypothetical protein
LLRHRPGEGSWVDAIGADQDRPQASSGRGLLLQRLVYVARIRQARLHKDLAQAPLRARRRRCARQIVAQRSNAGDQAPLRAPRRQCLVIAMLRAADRSWPPSAWAPPGYSVRRGTNSLEQTHERSPSLSLIWLDATSPLSAFGRSERFHLDGRLSGGADWASPLDCATSGSLGLSVCMLHIHGIEVEWPGVGRDAFARQDHQPKLTEG